MVLGYIYIVAGRQLKCSVTHAKRSFHRCINLMPFLEKISRIVSEEVILQLVNCKCMPVGPTLWTRVLLGS